MELLKIKRNFAELRGIEFDEIPRNSVFFGVKGN